jgi:hypothetical protein
MFYLCFCYNANVHVAENVQQRPLGSHFSVGRRIRCDTGSGEVSLPDHAPLEDRVIGVLGSEALEGVPERFEVLRMHTQQRDNPPSTSIAETAPGTSQAQSSPGSPSQHTSQDQPSPDDRLIHKLPSQHQSTPAQIPSVRLGPAPPHTVSGVPGIPSVWWKQHHRTRVTASWPWAPPRLVGATSASVARSSSDRREGRWQLVRGIREDPACLREQQGRHHQEVMAYRREKLASRHQVAPQ